MLFLATTVNADMFTDDLVQELNTKFNVNYRNCEIISNHACKRLEDQQFGYVSNVGVHAPHRVKGHRIVVYADRFGDLYMVTSPWDISQEPKIIIQKVNGNHLFDACRMIYPNWNRVIYYDRAGHKLRQYKRKVI